MGEIDLNDLEQFCLLGEEGLEPECAIGRLNLALEGKPESIAIILICLAGDRVLAGSHTKLGTEELPTVCFQLAPLRSR